MHYLTVIELVTNGLIKAKVPTATISEVVGNVYETVRCNAIAESTQRINEAHDRRMSRFESELTRDGI